LKIKIGQKLQRIIEETPYVEDDKTLALFEYFESIKGKTYLTKDQTIKVLLWKSPRPKKHFLLNSENDFKSITKLSFKQDDERLKIHVLTALKGVKYPSASAILMFLDKSYPVLDIRVWKELHKLKLVSDNPRGTNFTLNNWIQYLTLLREIGKVYNLNARQIEKRIFDFDKRNQVGNLYK